MHFIENFIIVGIQTEPENEVNRLIPKVQGFG